MSAFAGLSNQACDLSLKGVRWSVIGQIRALALWTALRGRYGGPVYNLTAISLPRIEPGGRKSRTIRRIREVLGLQHQGVALAVEPLALAGGRPVEEVSRIELQPRRRGEQLQHPARARVLDSGGALQDAGLA